MKLYKDREVPSGTFRSGRRWGRRARVANSGIFNLHLFLSPLLSELTTAKNMKPLLSNHE